MRGKSLSGLFALIAVCYSCGRPKEDSRSETLFKKCIAEACQIIMIGDLQRTDDAIGTEVLGVLRRYDKALVVLTMSQDLNDVEIQFGSVSTGVRRRSEIAPYVSERFAAASSRPGVIAYVRDGITEIIRWDPKKRERRRIMLSEKSDRVPGGPRFEVLWLQVEEKPKRVLLHILMPAPVNVEEGVGDLRRWLRLGDDVGVVVTFLGQRRVFDDRFPVQNPMVGAWPASEAELGKDTEVTCVNPSKPARSSTKCWKNSRWTLLGR